MRIPVFFNLPTETKQFIVDGHLQMDAPRRHLVLDFSSESLKHLWV